MPGQSPTVYVHIGLAKTGTTYLQGLMWGNRRRLDGAGVRLPGQRRKQHLAASSSLCEQSFDQDLATTGPAAWDALADEARRAPARVVISHETLSRATAEQAKHALASLEPAEVHLIVTMRDLARQVPALWQERLKNRSKIPYSRFLKRIARGPDPFWRGQDVLDVLARWGGVPAERVHVVTVPRPGAPRGLLWTRFASVVGVDPAIATREPKRANESLSVAEAELLRRLNPALRKGTHDRGTYFRVVKRHLAPNVLAGMAPQPRITVPEEHRDWMRDRARLMIDGLASGGFDVVGDLADLEPDFGDAEFVSPESLSAEQLMELAAQCVTAVLVQNNRLRASGRDKSPARRLAKVRSEAVEER
ncbi:MAG: hypothetical protein GEU93_08735 [Propionibacteriales bacterium]|nr:hypothetical protein [Propionibacteriales bacterium]